MLIEESTFVSRQIAHFRIDDRFGVTAPKLRQSLKAGLALSPDEFASSGSCALHGAPCDAVRMVLLAIRELSTAARYFAPKKAPTLRRGFKFA